MQLFAYRNTEAGIRAKLAAFNTHATFEVEPPKPIIIVSPFRRIERRACRIFKVLPAELRSQRRGRQVANARLFIYYWATRLTPMTLRQIGRLLGNRDHSTVAYGRDAYPKKRAKMGRTLRQVR